MLPTEVAGRLYLSVKRWGKERLSTVQRPGRVSTLLCLNPCVSPLLLGWHALITAASSFLYRLQDGSNCSQCCQHRISIGVKGSPRGSEQELPRKHVVLSQAAPWGQHHATSILRCSTGSSNMQPCWGWAGWTRLQTVSLGYPYSVMSLDTEHGLAWSSIRRVDSQNLCFKSCSRMTITDCSDLTGGKPENCTFVGNQSPKLLDLYLCLPSDPLWEKLGNWGNSVGENSLQGCPLSLHTASPEPGKGEGKWHHIIVSPVPTF